MIEELIDLLSCNELAPTEVAAMAEFVRRAPEDPELDWIEDSTQAMTFAICSSLMEFVAAGDKVDELHEQLQAMFADPLPAYPYDDEAIRDSSYAYFRWLDGILATRGTTEGGYELLSIDVGLDDQLQVLAVKRKDSPRILELSELLMVRISRENGIESWN